MVKIQKKIKRQREVGCASWLVKKIVVISLIQIYIIYFRYAL
jgi:hypothetical protein